MSQLEHHPDPMFRRIQEILSKINTGRSLEEAQEYSIPPEYTSSTEDISIETLRDDYERRTWHHTHAQKSLGHTNPRLLNWIGSIDHSGYTREKCLNALILNYQPGDENRILLRLADWVPEVQVVARSWTLEHFKSLSWEAIQDNQHLILYLSRKHHLQNDPGFDEIKRDLLERTKSMTAEELFICIPMFRRFLFSLSLAADGYLRPWILDDQEPFNRLILLSEIAFAELTSDEMDRLRNDASIFVRRRFFNIQIDSDITPSKEELLTLALSPNRSMRELGQFHLKRIYQEDAYSIYQSKLGEPGESFFFIADFARKEDTAHFFNGVRTGSKTTQYYCLRALAAVAPERLNELNLADLISQNRKMRSVLLPYLPQLLSLDEILALRATFEASSPHGTISFLRVLERKSFWAFVDGALDVLISNPSEPLYEFIVRTIHHKVEINESLPVTLKESIQDKLNKLRIASKNQYGSIIKLLEFTIADHPPS